MARTKKNEETTEVAVRDESLPAYLQGYEGPLGTEDLGENDVRIPQLLIGEAMSEPVKEGLVSDGDLYLNVDMRKIAARDEDTEIVIVGRTSEVLLWRDRNDQSEGDRIMARAKRVRNSAGGFYHVWESPNTMHKTKFKGAVDVEYKLGEVAELDGTLEFGSANPSDKDCKSPAATKHYNMVVYLPAHELVATVSLSRTRAAAAENLNTLLKMSDAPIWARSFKIRVIEKKASTGNDRWNTVTFLANGYADPEAAEKTRTLFESFGSKGFEVDRTGEQGSTTKSDDGLV